MEITNLDINELIPYARNARTHSEEQVAQIAGSIKEFGFINPVLIDGEGGIIAGHGRVLAARKLGLSVVPVISLDHLTEIQKRAYILADNKLALNAGWDDELLKLELEDLKELDFDLDLIGFTKDELNLLMDDPEETQEGLTDDDEVPEIPSNPITKLGDIWLLGDHRVMCGDSTSIDAVEKLMDGKKADICFTSPPYNAIGAQLISNTKEKKENKYNLYNDKKTEDDYLNFLVSFVNSYINSCRYLIINLQSLSGNKRALIRFQHVFIDYFCDLAIWTKSNPQPAMGRNIMNSAFELVYFLSSESQTRAINSGDFRGTVSNVFDYKVARNEFSDIHNATFTVEFAEHYINSFSVNNSIIVDSFCGTGTSLIACEKTNRTCYAMELDEKYCDVIVKRWQDFTGKEAILESTGLTFNSCEK